MEALQNDTEKSKIGDFMKEHNIEASDRYHKFSHMLNSKNTELFEIKKKKIIRGKYKTSFYMVPGIFILFSSFLMLLIELMNMISLADVNISDTLIYLFPFAFIISAFLHFSSESIFQDTWVLFLSEINGFDMSEIKFGGLTRSNKELDNQIIIFLKSNVE